MRHSEACSLNNPMLSHLSEKFWLPNADYNPASNIAGADTSSKRTEAGS